MSRLLIKAAMRSAELGHLADQIRRLEDGGIDALHFDVMDGRFVPELCMGPSFIRGLRRYTPLPFEVHLLVHDPEACWAPYVEAGADCVLIHIETSSDPSATLGRIRAQGRRAGLAIAPATSARTVTPYLAQCDLVNVMTVTPGHPGTLEEGGVRNLTELAEAVQRHGHAVVIQADGAVSTQTRQQFVEAGATSLVASYPIFSRDVFGQAIAELRDELVMKESGRR
jgi:ribulose-phosphate 3-epimerase